MPKKRSKKKAKKVKKIKVPKIKPYYGSFTKKALRNFQISGRTWPMEFIKSITLIKKAAAKTNASLNLLEERKKKVILVACKEILQGKRNNQFPLDMIQAGGGTATNMNVNEVIAGRATRMLRKGKVHPNDDVNMSQSTNDVIPTAIRITALKLLPDLMKELSLLEKEFRKKAKTYQSVVKLGRTHLQDAVPLRIGQELEAFANMLLSNQKELEQEFASLYLVSLGGTAIGTGINTSPKYKSRVLKELKLLTKLDLKPAKDPIQLTSDMNPFVAASSALKQSAITLEKISNDLRLLSSGPIGALSEYKLEEVEPGSSIMPGKVNPSIPEAVNMTCYRVFGNDQALTLAAENSQLQLNVMTPTIASSLIESLMILTKATKMLREKCIHSMKVDKKRCKELLEKSTALATALAPHIGYDATARLVKDALKSGIGVKQLVLKRKILSKQEVERFLKAENFTRPNRK